MRQPRQSFFYCETIKSKKTKDILSLVFFDFKNETVFIIELCLLYRDEPNQSLQLFHLQ
jgi:hypothetical protein